ncbi:DUF4251 domain-containing protein [Polaribacter vadi]|uniref:DUF4251 domain-containing protein n=1 Tax=Polaribacter TaxID=52959 RepID=UPI001C0A62EA|nr:MULTISPECIES: DUF4251 domain-containing protein [Polaribacter]MBU3012371.1 DUF4251 domain-containing protein [Polaribacter vadi]MDO6742188.1 DUF4251 domain-containing protein [Polaribacter sp. 1_MG-2023]
MNFKFQYLFLVIPVLLFTACKSTVTVPELEALQKMVANNHFEFTAGSANPMPMANVRGLEKLLPVGSNMSNINLIGNANYFRVKNDSIFFELPYYGVRQIGSTYGSDVGLKFEGNPEKGTTTYNKKKKRYSLKYVVKTKDETLNINLILFVNNKATLSINSSHRSNINYNGTWQESINSK